MAMRRGHHTNRVLKALGTPDPTESHQPNFPQNLGTDEVLPADIHDEEEE